MAAETAGSRVPGSSGSIVRDLLILLVLSAAVLWIGLDRFGLRSSEGHRVVPASHILETGEWLPTRMGEAAYVRKPPGMAWAIALSMHAFGDNELAGRIVSALAATFGVLLAYIFARRWFGAKWALAAGLCQLLIPRLWMTARAAEIEALHNVFVQLAAYCVVDLLVRRRGRGVLIALVGGVAVSLAFLVKGPAGWLTLCGVLVCGMLFARGVKGRGLMSVAAILVGLYGSAGVFGLVAWSVGDESVVVSESPGRFLGGLEDPLKVIGMAPTAILGAAPACLCLVLPFGRNAKRESLIERDDADFGVAYSAARTLACGYLASLAFMTLLLMTNPRYGDPSIALLSPLAAYGLMVMRASPIGFRRRALRVMLLGHPVVWVVVLVATSSVWVWVMEPRRADDAGDRAGASLAGLLEEEAEFGFVRVLTDGVLDARPDVLWYAARELRDKGIVLELEWDPRVPGGELDKPEDLPGAIPLPELCLLREDEITAFQERFSWLRFERLGEGKAGKFEFVLVRVSLVEEG